MNETAVNNKATDNNLVKKILIMIVLTISGGALCYVNIFDKLGKTESIVNVILACVVWIYASYKLFDKFEFEKLPALLSLFMTLCTVKMTMSLYPERHLAIILLSSFAVFLCLYVVLYYLQKTFFLFIDTKEKQKEYLIFTIILLLIITICYSLSQNFYWQIDYVYSMDSGWVFKYMYRELDYYDIRHPLSSIIFFPIYASVCGLLKFFRVTSTVALAIILQYIQSQFIIITAFVLEKLTDNKWVKYIYLLSGPVILAIIFFEKYPIIIFLLTLSIYCIKEEKKETPIILGLSCGSILTSSIVMFFIFLNRNNDIKKKLFQFINSIFATIFIFLIFGRLGVMTNGLVDMQGSRKFFVSIPLISKVMSYINMIGCTLVTMTPDIASDKIWWDGLYYRVNYLGLLIMLIMLVLVIKKRKDFVVLSSCAWFCVSVLLIFVAGYSINESPLFSYYFSWATTILFVEFLKYIDDKQKNNGVIYYVTCISMALLNASTIIPVLIGASKIAIQLP